MAKTIKPVQEAPNHSLQADRPDGRRPELKRYAFNPADVNMANEIRNAFRDLRELDARKRDLDEREQKLEEREEDISDREIKVKKHVEYYSQSYASFYQTTLEKDKSILTLSTAGLGFLVTFVGVSSALPVWGYALLVPASMAFLVAIFLIVRIFGQNSKYIVAIVTDEDHGEIEYSLRCMDRWAIRCFYAGIIFAFALGMSVSIFSESKAMTKEIKTSDGLVISQDSYASGELITKSSSGAAAMKPQFEKPQATASQQSTKPAETQEKKPK